MESESQKIARFVAPKRAENAQQEWEFDANATYSEVIFDDSWRQHRPEAYHQYRRDWVEVPKRKVELDFPLHLDIETTTHCNLKCPMCPRTLMVEQGNFDEWGFLTRPEYAAIIDQGAEHGAKSAKLNYLGEPLLHKDVAWQVAYAKKNGFVDVLMNTNGSALTKKNSRAILEAGVDGVFVSFDAVNPRDYERQRVGATLGRVIDNLYAFAKLRDEIRPGCQVRVSMVMYDDPKWMRQYQALSVMWDGIVDAVGYSWYTERDSSVSGEYPEVPGFRCAQPFHRMFLKANGNVTVCCFDNEDEVVVGDWRREKLYDIWNGEKYKDVRRIHAEGRYRDMDICRRCYFPVSFKQPGAVAAE